MAPATDPRPPITAVEKTVRLSTGSKVFWPSLWSRRTCRPPATPAMTPESRKPESFTLMVGTAAASAARWLSRVATTTLPLRALRTPKDARMARARKARHTT